MIPVLVLKVSLPTCASLMEWILEGLQFGMEPHLIVANLIEFFCVINYSVIKLEHLDLVVMGQYLGGVWESPLVMFTPHNFKSTSPIARDRNWLGGRCNVCTAPMEVPTLSLIQLQL